MESLFWGRLDLGGGGQLGHCYPVIWIGGQCPDNMDSSLMNFPSGEQQSLTKSFDLSELLQYLLSFFNDEKDISNYVFVMVEIFFCSSRILQNVSRLLYSEFADAGSVPGISGESEIHLSSPQNEDFVRCFLTFDGDDDADVKIRKVIGILSNAFLL